MTKAYLEITLKIENQDRSAAAEVYTQYKAPFLETIQGAISKELLIHQEDVQVLHGFNSLQSAQEYLLSDLFNQDVVEALKPFLKSEPNVKIYEVA